MDNILVIQLESANTFGYFAAFLTTIAFLPQLIRILKARSADDVSLTMIVMFIVGLIFWIIYGWETKAIPVLIANIITLILNCSILILKLSYEQ